MSIIIKSKIVVLSGLSAKNAELAGVSSRMTNANLTGKLPRQQNSTKTNLTLHIELHTSSTLVNTYFQLLQVFTAVVSQFVSFFHLWRKSFEIWRAVPGPSVRDSIRHFLFLPDWRSILALSVGAGRDCARAHSKRKWYFATAPEILKYTDTVSSQSCYGSISCKSLLQISSTTLVLSFLIGTLYKFHSNIQKRQISTHANDQKQTRPACSVEMFFNRTYCKFVHITHLQKTVQDSKFHKIKLYKQWGLFSSKRLYPRFMF